MLFRSITDSKLSELSSNISDEIDERLWEWRLRILSEELFNFIAGVAVVKAAADRTFTEAIDGSATATFDIGKCGEVSSEFDCEWAGSDCGVIALDKDVINRFR